MKWCLLTVLYYKIWTSTNELKQNWRQFQVPSSSITYCHQWHCCLYFWILLRENSFDQALTKENMGRLYWSVFCYYDLCLCGELAIHLSIKTTAMDTSFLAKVFWFAINVYFVSSDQYIISHFPSLHEWW